MPRFAIPFLFAFLLTFGACQSGDTETPDTDASDDAMTTTEDVSSETPSSDNPAAALLESTLAEWQAAPINDRMQAAKVAVGDRKADDSELDYSGRVVDLEECLTDAAGDVEDKSMAVDEVLAECLDEITR